MPLSPSQTRALLESLGHRPRKPLGQNFLIDGNIVRKSLQLAEVRKGDQVVEIGPGLGTLTEALLETGCQVFAIELDRNLARHLRQALAPEYPDTFSLVEGDAVEHPRAGMPPEIANFKVVANLPYAITSPWLEALLQDPLPTDLVLMLQREAADRITAGPGSKSYGAISIFTEAAYEKAAVHRVSRSCFYPVPGVDSLLIHLKRQPRPHLFSKTTHQVIRQLFTQRRKQIGNLLQKFPEAHLWLDQLPAFGCTRASRPEAIPLTAWLALESCLA